MLQYEISYIYIFTQKKCNIFYNLFHLSFIPILVLFMDAQ